MEAAILPLCLISCVALSVVNWLSRTNKVLSLTFVHSNSATLFCCVNSEHWGANVLFIVSSATIYYQTETGSWNKMSRQVYTWVFDTSVEVCSPKFCCITSTMYIRFIRMILTSAKNFFCCTAFIPLCSQRHRTG